EAFQMALTRHETAVVPRPDFREVARVLREGELIDRRGERPAAIFKDLLERRRHAVVVRPTRRWPATLLARSLRSFRSFGEGPSSGAGGPRGPWKSSPRRPSKRMRRSW